MHSYSHPDVTVNCRCIVLSTPNIVSALDSGGLRHKEDKLLTIYLTFYRLPEGRSTWSADPWLLVIQTAWSCTPVSLYESLVVNRYSYSLWFYRMCYSAVWHNLYLCTTFSVRLFVLFIYLLKIPSRHTQSCYRAAMWLGAYLFVCNNDALYKRMISLELCEVCRYCK